MIDIARGRAAVVHRPSRTSEEDKMITSITDELVSAVVTRYGKSVERLNLSSNGEYEHFPHHSPHRARDSWHLDL